MPPWRSRIALLGLGMACLFAGCGPGTATISGEVTVDGKALDKGVIAYVAAEGQSAPVTAPIENGRYQVQTLPGKKLVQISAPVVIGKRPEYKGAGAPLVEITKERLPARYNSGTELTYQAEAGSSTKNWNLETKARKP